MPHRRLFAIIPLAVAASALLAPACAEEAPHSAAKEDISARFAALDAAERTARYTRIRDAAKARGVPAHAFLLAGIAKDETSLAHCWSEATWACQGPDSADCNGPVIAGAADGPCSDQQGGLGMFQFDAGTYAQTVAAYGADVLLIAGNVSHAIDYAIHMVKESAYTTNAETDDKALAWINNFDINNADLRTQWIQTVVRYYNGCGPGASCWAARNQTYNDALSYVLNDSSLAFWDTGPIDAAPRGSLDTAGCDAIAGWAQDTDAADAAIRVDLYFDGPAGAGHGASTTAGNNRPDLCTAINSCNHGFSLGPPFSLFNGMPHDVHAYGIDANGSANAELGNSPQQLNCPLSIPTGVTRWITDPTSLAAWRFDTYFDQLPAAATDVDKIANGPNLPATPSLVQVAGDPAVWLVDGAYKHHVPSPDVLTAWRWTAADITPIAAADLDAKITSTDVRARPVLLADSGGKLLLLDDPEPTTGAGGEGGAARGNGGAPSSSSGGSKTASGGASAIKGGSAGAAHGGSSAKGASGSSGQPNAPEHTGVLDLPGSDESSGCGVSTGGTGGLDLALLLGLAAVARRRR